MTQQAVLKRLKVIRRIQNQANRVPFKLKPRDVNHCSFALELSLRRQKGRSVCIACDWIQETSLLQYPSAQKCFGIPQSYIQVYGQTKYSHLWDCALHWVGPAQRGVLWAVEPNETITADSYRAQVIFLNQELKDKRLQYIERYDNVILQHVSARSHVGKVVQIYLEGLGWEMLPHSAYPPNAAPSDHHLFWSMAHDLPDQHLRVYDEVKNCIDSWITSKDDQIFDVWFVHSLKHGREWWLTMSNILNIKFLVLILHWSLKFLGKSEETKLYALDQNLFLGPLPIRASVIMENEASILQQWWKHQFFVLIWVAIINRTVSVLIFIFIWMYRFQTYIYN